MLAGWRAAASASTTWAGIEIPDGGAGAGGDWGPAPEAIGLDPGADGPGHGVRTGAQRRHHRPSRRPGAHGDVDLRPGVLFEAEARSSEAWLRALDAMAAHAAGPGAGGHTPSDLALSDLEQEEIELLEDEWRSGCPDGVRGGASRERGERRPGARPTVAAARGRAAFPPLRGPRVDDDHVRGVHPAMARVRSVTVATTVDASGRRWGFTGSSFSSLSLTPPLVLICLGKSASTHEAFITAESFMVNILAEGQAGIAMRFARSGADRFGAGDTLPMELGLPGIPEAAPGSRVQCTRSWTVGTTRSSSAGSWPPTSDRTPRWSTTTGLPAPGRRGRDGRREPGAGVG